MTPTEVTSIVRDLVVVAAAVSGSIVAWRGLQTWRRQLRGQTEYSLAKRMLVSSYKIRRQVWEVRNAFITSGEMYTAMKELGIDTDKLSLDDFSKKGAEAAYKARMRRLAAAWEELSADLLEASAIWGTQSQAAFAQLEKCLRTLNAHMTIFLRRQDTVYPRERALKIEETIYDQGTEGSPDVFGTDLNATIESIEAYLKPLLIH